MKQLLKTPEAYILAAIVAVLILVMSFTDRPEQQDPPMVDDWAISEAVDHPEFESRSTAPRPAWLPDKKLTPGSYFREIGVKQLSRPGYTATVRNVPEKEKEQVLDRYGIKWSRDKHGTLIDPISGNRISELFEFDHLISLELGGDNSLANIFPQPYAGRWGARIKDQYEDWLHREVVAGRIELRDAQKRIATDWPDNMARDMPDYTPPHGDAAE